MQLTNLEIRQSLETLSKAGHSIHLSSCEDILSAIITTVDDVYHINFTDNKEHVEYVLHILLQLKPWFSPCSDAYCVLSDDLSYACCINSDGYISLSADLLEVVGWIDLEKTEYTTIKSYITPVDGKKPSLKPLLVLLD